MNRPHTGAANPPPVAWGAPSTMGTGRSIPNHTPANRLGVKPVNQVLVPSLVVPVFPAVGTVSGSPPMMRWLRPVPLLAASWSMSTMMRATSESRTCVRSGWGSHTTSPWAFSTLRMGNGRTLVPMVAKAE